MQLTTYLHFQGDCEAAFQLYAKVLRGQIVMKMTYGETPDGAQTPPELKDKIVHIRLAVGDAILMGSDSPPGHEEPAKGFTVSIGENDPAEA